MHRVGVVVLSGLAVALVVVLAACGSAPATGSLKVSVSGLPSVVGGAVTVTKGSYSHTVTSTTTLSGLVPGTYSVVAQTVTLRRNVFDGTAASATVTVSGGGTASDSVAYAARPGDLWVTLGNNGGPEEFGGSSLASGNPTAGATITGLTSPYGMAFDASGNLWVSSVGTTYGVVTEYSASSLASGTPTAVTSFTTVGSTTAGIAFDSSGNLWVTNYGLDLVTEYEASTLGSSTPTRGTSIILAEGATFYGSSGLAFDAAGDLWVMEFTTGGSDRIAGFSASSLGSGSSVASVVIPLGFGGQDLGLAFNAGGDLWVTSSGSVVEYMAASSLVPKMGITVPTGGDPVGLAFDADGNLWVADNAGGTVVDYTAASLAKGSPVKGTTISMTTPFDIAFDPPPYNLPLSH